MGDLAKFTDDISALWGSPEPGVLEPALPARHPAPEADPPPEGPGATNGSVDPTEERLGQLEAHLWALGTAVEALRNEVLAHVDRGLADANRRAADAAHELAQRVAALEGKVGAGLARVQAALDRRQPSEEEHEQVARELDAVRTAAGQSLERRVGEAEARFDQRLDELAARVPSRHVQERLSALECRVALLAEAVEAYRREAVREPNLDAMRADLQAAAAEVATRTDDHLDHRFHELAGHLTHTTAARLDALDQRIARHGELLDSHRVQSVMGWELESLREELIEAVKVELAELRAELRAELLRTAPTANGNGGRSAAEAEAEAYAEEERRRLEASWQQAMPGF